MKRLFDRRVGFSVGAVGLLFATMAPALVPAFASASTITDRSIQMSSAEPYSAGPPTTGTGVSYQVTFTPATSGATDMLIYFCSNTPLSGTACVAPTGFDLTSATVTAGTGTTGATLDSTSNDAGNPGGTNKNVIAITGMTLGTSASTLTIGDVTNPSTVGTFYARIQTYASSGAQETAWADTSGGAVNGDLSTTYTDNGSVALSTNNSLGVSAAVLESLSFCLFGDAGNSNTTTASEASDSSSYLTGTSSTSVGTVDTSHDIYDLGYLTSANGLTNQAPGTNCNDSTAATYDGGSTSITPNVTLGQYVASNVYALDSSNVSYASDWTQVSTNASGGATVYLKSGNSCTGDGLSDNGGSTCGIPAASGTLTAGTAGFGVALGNAVNLDGQTGTGTDGQITLNSTYNASGTPKYALGTGSNGTYGTALYNTGTSGTPAPATNWDVPVGLGAAIANNTAAGNYKDNLNLIAVGTF